MTDKRKQELEAEIAYFRQQFEPINQQIQLPHSLTAEALRYRLQNEPAPAAVVHRSPWRWKLASAVVCLMLVALVLPLGRSLGLGGQLVSPGTAQAPMEASMESAPEESMPRTQKAMPQSGKGPDLEEEVPVEDDAVVSEEAAVPESKVQPNTAMMEAPRSASGSAFAAFTSQEELLAQARALLPAEAADETTMVESVDSLPQPDQSEDAVPDEVIMEEEPVEGSSGARPLLGSAVSPAEDGGVPSLSVGMNLSVGEEAAVQGGTLSLDEAGDLSWSDGSGQGWQLAGPAIQVTCVAENQIVLVKRSAPDAAWGMMTQVQWYQLGATEAQLLATLEQQGTFVELDRTQNGTAVLITDQTLSGENGEEQLLPHYRLDGADVTLSAQQVRGMAQQAAEPAYLTAVEFDAAGVQSAQAVLGARNMSWQDGELLVTCKDGSQQPLSLQK